MGVAGPVAVHQMEMGHPGAQQVQIFGHRFPRRRRRHHVAHAQQAGGVHLLQRLGQLSRRVAQIALPGGEALQQDAVADGLGVGGQYPQAVGEPFPQRPPGHAAAAVTHGDQGVLRPQSLPYVQAQLQVVHGILPLEAAARHIVVGVGIVLRGVDPYRHLVLLGQGQHLFQLSPLQVGGKGVGPAAPQLDVVIPQVPGVGKGPLQGAALVTAGEHAQFHRLLLTGTAPVLPGAVPFAQYLN